AEAAGADQQDLRVEQLQLPLLPDLRDQQVAAVARSAWRVEARVQLDGMAVPFPVGEAAGERDDVLVAHLLERLRGEGRAVADRAIEDDRLTRVRGGALDARLEVAARDVHSPWDVALVPLVLLADIDDERLASFDQLAGACGVDLGDLGAHLL